MENAVDALMMAGSVLLLVLALTVSISSFSSLKSQVDDIIQLREQTDLAQAVDDDGNTYYLNYIKNADDLRTVGVETIISSIRRLRRENYNVYIYIQPTTLNSIDSDITEMLRDEGILIQTTQSQSYNGTEIIPIGGEIMQFTLSGSGYTNIGSDVMEVISGVIKNLQFKEYLGIYQEADTTENVSSSNKTTYRIVTYVQEV